MIKGRVLDYNSDIRNGRIVGPDGKIYVMSLEDCIGSIAPQSGDRVEFEPDDEQARKIRSLSEEIEPAAVPSIVIPTKNGINRPKQFMSLNMILALVFALGALIVVLIYSELQKRDMKELQNLYHGQISSIKTEVDQGNCSEAASEYLRARETRDKISKTGLYYSINPFEKQAHAIEIAECFAQRKEFENAVRMLNIEGNRDADYLLRASKIYRDSGNEAKAEEAESKAQKANPAK